MTSTDTGSQPSVDEVQRAVALAVRAPSIHNTQPWRFELTADALELWADRRRQLAAIDPDGWALLISCGGALYLAGLGLAAEGWRTTTERMPDPTRPDLLARLRFEGRQPVKAHVHETVTAARRRRTERRPFRPGAVPTDLLGVLCVGVEDPSLYASLVLRARCPGCPDRCWPTARSRGCRCSAATASSIWTASGGGPSSRAAASEYHEITEGILDVGFHADIALGKRQPAASGLDQLSPC